jgi:hypothetical protein
MYSPFGTWDLSFMGGMIYRYNFFVTTSISYKLVNYLIPDSGWDDIDHLNQATWISFAPHLSPLHSLIFCSLIFIPLFNQSFIKKESQYRLSKYHTFDLVCRASERWPVDEICPPRVGTHIFTRSWLRILFFYVLVQSWKWCSGRFPVGFWALD